MAETVATGTAATVLATEKTRVSAPADPRRGARTGGGPTTVARIGYIFFCISPVAKWMRFRGKKSCDPGSAKAAIRGVGKRWIGGSGSVLWIEARPRRNEDVGFRFVFGRLF